MLFGLWVVRGLWRLGVLEFVFLCVFGGLGAFIFCVCWGVNFVLMLLEVFGTLAGVVALAVFGFSFFIFRLI